MEEKMIYVLMAVDVVNGDQCVCMAHTKNVSPTVEMIRHSISFAYDEYQDDEWKAEFDRKILVLVDFDATVSIGRYELWWELTKLYTE